MEEKYILLSMDVEEWYNLDYIKKKYPSSDDKSSLDGLDFFSKTLESYGIKATYFLLTEIEKKIEKKITNLINTSNEIALHGKDHVRPTEKSFENFTNDIKTAKKYLENKYGINIHGYRAPSFAINDEQLDALSDLGFTYDSSNNPFEQHPLYGKLTLANFDKNKNNLYVKSDFFEVSLPTVKIGRLNIPISGGGYFRLIPWFILKRLISKHLKKNDYFMFYIHPYEFSNNKVQCSELNWINKKRANIGRKKSRKKFIKMINYFRKHDFRFLTIKEYLDLKGRF